MWPIGGPFDRWDTEVSCCSICGGPFSEPYPSFYEKEVTVKVCKASYRVFHTVCWELQQELNRADYRTPFRLETNDVQMGECLGDPISRKRNNENEEGDDRLTKRPRQDSEQTSLILSTEPKMLPPFHERGVTVRMQQATMLYQALVAHEERIQALCYYAGDAPELFRRMLVALKAYVNGEGLWGIVPSALTCGGMRGFSLSTVREVFVDGRSSETGNFTRVIGTILRHAEQGTIQDSVDEEIAKLGRSIHGWLRSWNPI